MSFVRTNSSGRAMRVVARRTLRTGTFAVKVPAATVAARYALRIEVAGHRRFSWVTTPAPAPATPAPAPVPAATATPEPQPISVCGDRTDRPWSAFQGAVRLAAARIRAGETLAYTLANVGQYELLDDQRQQLITDPPTKSYGWGHGGPYLVLNAGASREYTIAIPADTTPGFYRLLHEITVNATCDAPVPSIVKSEPFEVLAP